MKRKIVLITIQVVLGIAVLGACFWLYRVISTPIQFEKHKTEREAVVIDRLKTIRQLERMFKKEFGHFTDDLDSLTDFAINGKITATRKIVNEYDSTAMANAEIIYGKDFKNEEEIELPVRDSLFKNQTTDDIKNLRYIPFTDNQKEFKLKAGTKLASGVNIPVIECRVAYVDFLDVEKYKQEIINFIDTKKDFQDEAKRYPGLMFGGNNEAGNWED